MKQTRTNKLHVKMLGLPLIRAYKKMMDFARELEAELAEALLKHD